jgi:hypothetical protein
MRLYTHSLSFNPLWVAKGGHSIYAGKDTRYDRSARVQEGVGVYEQVKPTYPVRTMIRPVPLRDVEMGFTFDEQRSTVTFRTRKGDKEILTIGPLPEIPAIRYSRRVPRLPAGFVSVYENKLVSVGHRRRQLFVRDFEWP